jgi:7-carboxy-7-deazaguanine synthase
MKIRLVKNGIFPVLRGLDGNLTESSPNTGYPLAGTIQGEGKLAGIPVIFIRTAGCNLRCSWIDDLGSVDICDTPYSSHNVAETEDWEVEDVVRMVELNLGNMKHVVISGGEPTIQPAPLVNLVNSLKKKLAVHITLETNGVHYVPEITWKVDFFSISPKLKSSEPSPEKNKMLEKPVEDNYIRDHALLRRNTGTIQKYINACYHMESYYGDAPDTEVTRRGSKDFQLKFVIAKEEDEKEIKDTFLAKIGLFRNEDILVMPLGSTPEKTREHTDIAVKMAIRNGWRFAPRVQLEVFGDVAGT